VVSKAPLKDIINNSDATGQVAKWGIELASFDIDYKSRTAIDMGTKEEVKPNFRTPPR
jgi:predicted dithiol-disulfide oxidoreductase (DUF899 family)